MSLKSILLTSAIAFVAATGAAQAAPTLNLDGIVVPKNTIGHADGSVVVDLGTGVDTNAVVPNLSVVNVFGRVQQIGLATNPIGDIVPLSATWNADNPAQNNGKELTYQLMLTGAEITSPSAGIFDITVSSGSVTYYVDVAGDFDGTGADAADAMDGDVWLTAELITPEVFQLDVANGSLTADNNGLLFNAVGGPFLENFDTDQFNGADIFTFSLQANSGGFVLSPEGVVTGSTIGSTDTVFFAVSEPATLGMLGLGLVGMSLAGRRRNA